MALLTAFLIKMMSILHQTTGATPQLLNITHHSVQNEIKHTYFQQQEVKIIILQPARKS